MYPDTSRYKNQEMKQEVVFILTSIVNTNSIKRIDEFVARGYKVSAYGFKRDVDVANKSLKVDIKVVGSYKNNLSYWKRLTIIYRGIRNVLKETCGKNKLYYLIGLDVAMLFRLQSKGPYVFEEADLVHTNIANKWIRICYENIDKSIIRHSVLSAFRSEGFVKYHYGENKPDNVCVIPNRLNESILNYEVQPRHEFDGKHIKIGYVGFIRYHSIYNFARVFCSHYPKCEFHFYGTFTNEKAEHQFAELKKIRNCSFHGSFRSPDDLSSIYSQFDLVLSTYDVSSENVRWAEPNKIYEAIYFETPIVVSSGTYLSDKVKKMDIGYDVNAMDEKSIMDFVDHISQYGIFDKVESIRRINKHEVINRNEIFFQKLEDKLKNNYFQEM